MATKRRSEAEILKEANERLTTRRERTTKKEENIVLKTIGLDKKIKKKTRKEGSSKGYRLGYSIRQSSVVNSKSILPIHADFKEKSEGKQLTIIESGTEFLISSSNTLKEIINNSNKKTRFKVIKSKIELTVKSYRGDKRKNILMTGAVMFHDLVLRKLKEISDRENEDNYKAMERYDYFFKNKSDFLSNFLKEIPDGTYSDFFNNLFDVKSTSWRTEFLANGENQNQCLETIGDTTGEELCYLCGNKLKGDKICEHLLPISEALMHFWLMQGRAYSHLTEKSKELLKNEYAWAHDCCNKQKSYKMLIKQKISGEKVEYEINEEEILNLLDRIHVPTCKKIRDKMLQMLQIEQKFVPIINVINESIQYYTADYYPLYIKYKLICAISDEKFEKIILGKISGGGGELKHDLFEKINPIDALANILQSEYLDNIIIKDIEKYNNEIDRTPTKYYLGSYIEEKIKEDTNEKYPILQKHKHIKKIPRQVRVLTHKISKQLIKRAMGGNNKTLRRR